MGNTNTGPITYINLTIINGVSDSINVTILDPETEMPMDTKAISGNSSFWFPVPAGSRYLVQASGSDQTVRTVVVPNDSMVYSVNHLSGLLAFTRTG